MPRFSFRQFACAILAVSMLFAAVHYYLRLRGRRFRQETTRSFTFVAEHLSRHGLPANNVVYDAKGNPLFSWRLEVLLWWHAVNNTSGAATSSDWLGVAFDQPWDAPANNFPQTIDQPFGYRASYWKDGTSRFRKQNDPRNITRILAVVGPGTAFGDGAKPPAPKNQIPPDTIVAVESKQSGINWAEPGDLDVRVIEQRYRAQDPAGISSIHADGFHVAFADGTVWILKRGTPFDLLEPFLTVEGAKRRDRDTELARYRVY